jgi:hypothetical protein
VQEFLGIHHCGRQAPQDWARVVDDAPDPQIVVLDDANLGFRGNQDLWPIGITKPKGDPWILVKMAKPVAQGDLWKHLYRENSKKLIVVMTVNDLRLSDVQISRELSWECTAQDLAWEITYNPSVNSLARCAHVVVSFNAAGAVLYSRDGGGGQASWKLLFDPNVIEGEWEQQHEGRMIGYTSCLTAGIARQLMLKPEAPDLVQGVCSGLVALRTLHQEGYGQRGLPAHEVQLEFPVAAVVSTLAEEERPFKQVDIPSRTDGKRWTILDDLFQGGLGEPARKIVLHGVERVLDRVPIGSFGKLVTVDRQEIESFRSIRALISEYMAQGRPPRPLSVAAFGPPGSGKSFGIKQLAEALRPGEIEVREFRTDMSRS